jgi:hypothetical protein
VIQVLDAGIDTLYWSARARCGDWYPELLALKAAARVDGAELPWREFRGFAFSVLPQGRSVYPFAARCAEFEVRLTDSAVVPTIYVQLRASFLRTVGAREAVAESVAVVAEMVRGPVGEVRAARLDVFADVGGFALTAADRSGFDTRAGISAYWRGAGEELPSIRAGAGSFKVRVYDKRRERSERSEPMPVAWGDFADVVARVEVEAHSGTLRRFGIRTVDEALASYGDVWRYGTEEFFVLRASGPGPLRSWPVRDEWRLVQAAGAVCFPVQDRVPGQQAVAEKSRAVRTAFGALASVAAHDGLWTLDEVLEVLPDEIRATMPGRSFADTVRRRWMRLSREARAGSMS